MSSNTFYLTTTLPYVNAAPHIGFALEIVAADVIARYQRLLGKEVIFNTGTDEHGQKIYQKALENNQDPQAYADEYAAKFDDLKKILSLSYDHFVRTTNLDHKAAAQEFWKRCDTNGYIYKNEYRTKYCVGCELEKTDSDLEDGRCPLHRSAELEIREEENYFFKFSAFQKQLLDLYEKNPEFVKPVGKQKEITSFVKGDLKDFSISRLREKMPWGVSVPGDDKHVMYVWFDALVNYISTLGWPNDQEKFDKFWPVIQLAGKDNLRQQSAMWQAMLMAADLPNSKKILINGFIGVDGQKMSKSLGNVIAPSELVNKYGVDAARYLIMNLGPFGEDMDVSWKKLDEVYTADLSNGLGNLCSRVAKMCEKAEIIGEEFNQLNNDFSELMDNYDLGKGLSLINNQVSAADQYLSENTPWKKEGDEQKKILVEAVKKIQSISYHLQPFMPETAEKILAHFSQSKITALKPLFPRLT
ncbi:MAG: methionine--tRNA ligase [Candidatus Pacebacteria bacterium]|nr:methionine--tRNA ligase [Candidatus Paceibacterota bacterium]